MLLTLSILFAVAATVQSPSPSADPQLLAQAQDRCMTTHAVQMTRTEATDEAIYAQASSSCAALNDQLLTAIKAKMPPVEAAEITSRLTTTAKPRFLALLTRIRSDRAAREAAKP